MPGTDYKQACEVSERLRLIVAQSPTDLGTHTIPMTISVGIAEFTSAQDTLDLILHRADQALYAAKQSGRNRVIAWQASLEA